jgi:hypothetical protein
MLALEHGHYHAWQGVGFLLSDERTKTLRSFPDIDHCINWLFMNGAKDTARKLNQLKKESTE